MKWRAPIPPRPRLMDLSGPADPDLMPSLAVWIYDLDLDRRIYIARKDVHYE